MIENPLDELRERLMSYEPSDAQLGERYRKEIDAMLHRGRGHVRQWIQIMSGIVFILLPLVCVLVVPRFERTPSPPYVCSMLIVSGSFMVIMGIAILVCGIRDIDPRRHRSLWDAIGAIWTALLAAAFLHASWQTPDPTLRWQLTEVAFVLLGIVGVTTIVQVVQHYHKRADLRLLQLEYRLADMAGQLRKRATE